jgi:small subunit ribosomal protein S13
MISFFLNPLFIKISIQQVLKKVPNVGSTKISFICKNLGLLKTTKWSNLTDKQIYKVSVWLEERFLSSNPVGSSFVKIKQEHIKYLKTLKNYRSIRLSKNLPARGQRTSTNAKTVKRIVY